MRHGLFATFKANLPTKTSSLKKVNLEIPLKSESNKLQPGKTLKNVFFKTTRVITFFRINSKGIKYQVLKFNVKHSFLRWQLQYHQEPSASGRLCRWHWYYEWFNLHLQRALSLCAATIHIDRCMQECSGWPCLRAHLETIDKPLAVKELWDREIVVPKEQWLSPKLWKV